MRLAVISLCLAALVASTDAVACSKKSGGICQDPAYWQMIINDIAAIIKADNNYGPKFLRFAWHSAGTHNRTDRTGGSNGGSILYTPEINYSPNAGLYLAVNAINPVIAKYPDASCADIVILSGIVAVDWMGGPKIPFRPGRKCETSLEANSTYNRADLLLPPAIANDTDLVSSPTTGSFPYTVTAVRNVFSRMGMTDQETVALIGAHAVGKCHANFSGFEGRWTSGQFSFSNTFFIQLKTYLTAGTYSIGTLNDSDNRVSKQQYVNGAGLMMLPADIAFLYDPSWRIYVDQYANDATLFSIDFSRAFAKLTELGCEDVITSTPYVYGASAVNYTTTKSALTSSLSIIAVIISIAFLFLA